MDRILDDPALAPYALVARPDALAREGLFVVEGRLILPRLLASRYRVHSVLLSNAAHAALAPMLTGYPDAHVIVAPADVISQVAGFAFHQGCLALGFRDELPNLEQVLAGSTPGAGSREPILILESVSNPDNIGGLFRSAHALGARAVLLGPRSGDPLYRKAIRTSMGATLDVPWTTLGAFPDSLHDLRTRGYHLVALTPDAAAMPVRDAVARADAPIAFLLGSEGHGLSSAALAAAGTRARIPMQPGADSLNITAAASIALYETLAR